MSVAANIKVEAPALSAPSAVSEAKNEGVISKAQETIKDAATKTQGWLAKKYEQAIDFAAEHVYADVSKLKTEEKDGWLKTIGKVVAAVFALAVMLPIAAIVKLYKSAKDCACSKADAADKNAGAPVSKPDATSADANASVESSRD